jgi:HTH-type transcriptional regulator/antitoxin HigA
MEQKGLTRKDLEPYLGTRARVSEVLNKKRNLTLPMIKKLHEGLKEVDPIPDTVKQHL